MQFLNSEVAVVEESPVERVRREVSELTDLELTLVGGGIGDIVAG